MSKPIQVRPRPELSDKVDELVGKRYASSRAAFGELAIEAFVPLIESGVVAVVNGQIVWLKSPKLKAAA